MRTIGLALWCVLAAGSAFAQNVTNDPPDTIFYNGTIITVDSEFSIQQAFAIKGDVYVAVGTNARIRGLAGRNTRLVDLQGSAVIPGLSDNHDHLYPGGPDSSTASDGHLRGRTEGVLRARREGNLPIQQGEKGCRH